MLYAIWQYVFFCAVVESKKQFRWFHNTASMAPKTLKIPIQCAVFYDTKVLTVLLAFSPTRPLRLTVTTRQLRLTVRWFSPTRQLRFTVRWFSPTRQLRLTVRLTVRCFSPTWPLRLTVRWFSPTRQLRLTVRLTVRCFSPTWPLRLTVRWFSPTRQLRWLLPRTLRWLASTLLPTLRPTNYRYVFRAIRCRCFRWHCTFTGKLCFLAEVSALLRMLSWGYCAWLFMIDKSFRFRSIIIFCIIPLLPLFRDNPLASLWESLHELHSMANYVL